MERVIVTVICAAVVLGAVLAHVDGPAFEKSYVEEDGLIEWGTVPALLLGAFVCLRRFFLLRGRKPALFLAATILFGTMFVFGAGEEISWGQRILGIRSPAWFQAYNAQHDTNIHNLRFGRVKINKLVFSQCLTAVIAVYILLLPPLYRWSAKAARLISALAIPVPRPEQACVVVFLVALVYGAVSSSSRGELGEFGLSWMIALCFMFPVNAADLLARPPCAGSEGAA